MESTLAAEENVNSKENELGVIRGRVTYARGSVPLAEVKCRVAESSANSSNVTNSPIESSTPENVNPEVESATTEAPELPSSTTDLAGAYQFSSLEPGTYEVTVTPPKGWNYKAEPQLLKLAPGEIKVADFKLEPIPLETIFTGQVFDSNGLPAKGARMGGVVCSNSYEPVVVVTESDGRFVFKNVEPGDRFVRIMLPEHVAVIHDFSIEEGQTLTLNFNLMKADFKIHGTVTNSEAKPVKAELQLFMGGPMRAMVIQKTQNTTEDGTFEFYVNEGQYSILAQARGYEMGAWEGGKVSEDRKADIQLVEYDPRRHTHPVLSPTEAQEQGYPG